VREKPFLHLSGGHINSLDSKLREDLEEFCTKYGYKFK